MTELDTLKARLREAKDKLTRRRSKGTEGGEDAHMMGHSKLWNLKLQMAMEHNYALEQRLAWEIETRNLVEQYTRQQIRQLQEILECLLRQQYQQQEQPSQCPPLSTTTASPVPRTETHRHLPFMMSSTQPNSLSPLLTEVMHVQLKFAETMQSLNESVQARESLLTPPPSTRRQRRRQDNPVDDDEDTDDDMLPMATYTHFLDKDDTPPRMHQNASASYTSPSPRPPTTFTSPMQDDVSSSLLFTSPLLGQDSVTPPTDDSKRSVHFMDDLSTPTVGRAISFHDCADDDDDSNDNMQQHVSPPAIPSPVMSPHREGRHAAPSSESSITSSALNRSSFMADFERFRESLKIVASSTSTPPPDQQPRAPLPSTSSTSSAYYPNPVVVSTHSYSKKAEWSLEVQRLCTERALLQLEQRGTPTQLKQLDIEIAYARSQVVKFT
ncbi:hypothetical protein DYB28_006366 [Aphanomyces astaci]|uniref:Uncharacterized protein n=1 Tax=Aphanomyces astaci TaxID=112090 RepID=A0A397E4G4_APHAT|nr:hypothetical protein DYB25_004730 [Aphanomyces astaci]RHY44526.1 hypothetical protein DYB34_003041 [Aphanomyces astaci]RHY59111.1 hypothetical protein DYB30_003574 [Aphanomyces astaci]RHY73460.1 hypothetical protein DYB38_003664 [Aphanomyces astaci]RHZ18371.1 hypothetical protein DYB31_004661 [Aphanomyces astaci]